MEKDDGRDVVNDIVETIRELLEKKITAVKVRMILMGQKYWFLHYIVSLVHILNAYWVLFIGALSYRIWK